MRRRPGSRCERPPPCAQRGEGRVMGGSEGTLPLHQIRGSMTNAQRNRLKSRLMLAAMVATSAAFVWILGEAHQWRTVRIWLLAAAAVGGWSWFAIASWRDRRTFDSIERELRKAGV